MKKHKIRRLNEISLAYNFLLKSISKDGGSRAYFSRLYNPIKGWSKMYPETTGYLIPTFINYGKFLKDESKYQYAKGMADWLLSIQNDDGSYFSGLHREKINPEKSIFNSAQIIFGMISIYRTTQKEEYYASALKCAEWIAGSQNKKGYWDEHNYEDGYTPSYYARVAWPILLVWSISKNDKLLNSASLLLENLANRKLKNKFIRDSGFKPNGYAFTHTIAYTIRGFLESSYILNNKSYYDIAKSLSEKFLKKFEINSKLFGAYDENFRPAGKYECLTGSVQFAIIWLKLYKDSNDIRYLNSALKIIDQVSEKIPRFSLIKKKGGVPGSYPFWGRYMFFRQPNWASKFFIDASILELECLGLLEEKIQE